MPRSQRYLSASTGIPMMSLHDPASALDLKKIFRQRFGARETFLSTELHVSRFGSSDGGSKSNPGVNDRSSLTISTYSV
jgi:hypothetical protein